MKWMKERDLLIAQTMAFVQSVTGKPPEAAKPPEVAKPPQAPRPPQAARALESASTPEAVETVAAPAAPRTVETFEPARPAVLTLPEIALVLPQTPPPPAKAPIVMPAPSAEVQPPIVKAATIAAPAETPRQISSLTLLPRLDLREDFQSEIRARVASFRAHQERFNREREAYCAATMAKVHASLKETEPPRHEK